MLSELGAMLRTLCLSPLILLCAIALVACDAHPPINAPIASQDLTNREIAQMLFITARTVEGHLTSVFRKLQLDSRNGLSAVLGNDVLVSA